MSTVREPDGVASSALGIKRGLAIEWGCGFYLLDRRLIITQEVVASHLGWDPNGSALLGSFSTKIDTFFDKKQKTIEELEKSAKKFDVDRSNIASIRLKKPGVFLGGSVEFKLQSGNGFKLFVADQSIAYSNEAFTIIKDIVSPISRYL